MPSSINPLPVSTIIEGARKTGKVIIIEEGTSGFNWGSEVATVIYEQLLGELKTPIARLSSAADIIPTSSLMEDKMLISKERIKEVIFEIL